MHPILIKNADVYAPEHLGTRDIFLAGGKIVAMAEKLDVTLPDLEVIDAAGYIVAPGLVDQHIHITGGGGEGGWHSRCPELVFSELVKAGVTTFLGVSGTDSMTRSVENLLAKVRGLKNEGASGWMWTSNYAYPVTTITKDVRTDMLAIPEVLGVKIALGDHRSSFPNQHEIMQILADVRVSGMLTGKTGFLHVHLGDFPYSFDIFDECIAQGMPIKHIRPTHVARHPEVFRRACEFAKKGGFIDITTGGGNYMGSAADAVRAALADGVPFDRITLSSDGHGSMPRFNEAGEMVGLGIGSIMCDIETLRELKDDLGVEKALTPMTKTVAGALGLETKGGIAVGKDADLLFLTKDLDIDWVFMMGKVAMRKGEVVMKGAFEE
ncbi:MAG TPA: beta-aspartyl-peptidase [Candidatus Sutterella merdavium]|nr:beta-aspartyl-peptidase [Candidatus Sutterella merdavium]